VLSPERNVNVKTAPMDGYFKASSDNVLFAHAIKDDVDRAHENFPDAIQTEKVA
jgi:hypothetical protein